MMPCSALHIAHGGQAVQSQTAESIAPSGEKEIRRSGEKQDRRTGGRYSIILLGELRNTTYTLTPHLGHLVTDVIT